MFPSILSVREGFFQNFSPILYIVLGEKQIQDGNYFNKTTRQNWLVMLTGMYRWSCTKTRVAEMVFHVSIYHQFFSPQDYINPLLSSWKSISRTVNTLHLNRVLLESERSTSVTSPCGHLRGWSEVRGLATAGEQNRLAPHDLDC